jgi:hypothetical protein
MPNHIELYPQIVVSAPKMKDMECPHCRKAFHGAEKIVTIGRDADGEWAVSGFLCPRPECNRFSLYLHKGERHYLVESGARAPLVDFKSSESRLIRPETLLPNPIPQGVPKDIEQDYVQATRVLSISLTASAALSRRCLQNILRQRSAQDTPDFPENGSLYAEIEAVIASNKLSPTLNDKLHAVRKLGNLGAHPLQDKHTNLVVNVDPEEAQLTLNIINDLLDYYYVQVPKTKAILEGIGKKINATKRPKNEKR